MTKSKSKSTFPQLSHRRREGLTEYLQNEERKAAAAARSREQAQIRQDLGIDPAPQPSSAPDLSTEMDTSTTDVLKPQHNTGISKKKEKGMSRKQRRRLEQSMARASIVDDKLDNKINKSEKKERRTQQRRVRPGQLANMLGSLHLADDNATQDDWEDINDAVKQNQRAKAGIGSGKRSGKRPTKKERGETRLERQRKKELEAPSEVNPSNAQTRSLKAQFNSSYNLPDTIPGMHAFAATANADTEVAL